MALLLPLLAFLVLIPLVRRWQPNESLRLGGWEGSLLVAACLWGALLTLILEVLSWMNAIRQGPLVLAWTVAVGLLMARLFTSRKIWPIRLPRWPLLASGEWALLGLVGVLVVGLLVVAWAAPPNNYDSLLYHMARVVHWAQHGSLRHFGTAYGHQLWSPPWSEMAILNARVLWGDDRPANLVQWSAYLGVLVGTSGIARLLDLGRSGRWLAVAFVASLPMAVLQATSTQNDLVVAFWLVAAVYLVLLRRRSPLGAVGWVALGAALGLGLLSKGTFYVFGAVTAAWLALTTPWKARPAASLAAWLAIGSVVLLLNLGQWSRNGSAFGTPLGPAEWIDTYGTAMLETLRPRLALYPVGVLRSVALHLAAPWPEWNQIIDAAVRSVSETLGGEVNGPIVAWSWNHEDLAGNPFHLVLFSFCLAAIPLVPRTRSTPVAGMASVIVAGWLLMVLLLPPSITPVGVRLHLPLFVLWAPIFSAIVSPWLPGSSWRMTLAACLTLAAVPWLLFNTTRPLIGLRSNQGALDLPCTGALGCTRTGSVLTTARRDSLYANLQESQRDHVAVVERIEQTACRNIGLRIDSSDPEYPLWWLLGAPESGYRLEAVYTTPELEPLLDRGYRPCAVVCTICGDRTRIHGLPLEFESGPVRLFIGAGYTWDEDG